MGSRTGIISVIPKNFDHAFPTMEKSLREHGMSMFPGTFKMLFPYKERNGYRRTGLDPDALYINNIKDVSAREAEKKRVTALRDKLEAETGLDLSPRSKYWDQMFPAKLRDGDNYFDFDNAESLITFSWLRVHPAIARSLDAYKAGEYPAETHFFVKDTDVEMKTSYEAKKLINDAIKLMDSLSLEKRRKVARIIGLPISEDSKEEFVYNELDNIIHQTAIRVDGPYKGQNGVHVFNSIAKLEDHLLNVKDVVETALMKKIYREGKAGRIMQGETTRFNSKQEMLNWFVDEDNQMDLIELQELIKGREVTA